MFISVKRSWLGTVAGGIMLLSPVAASANDVGGAIVGGIIGGIIGGAIINGVHHHPQTVRVYRERDRTPAVSERTMKTQQALAFFGLYHGTIDGRTGQGTRAAIVEFQQKLNVAATGDLTDEQYRALLAVYAERSNPNAAPSPSPADQPRPENNPQALIEAINRSTQPGGDQRTMGGSPTVPAATVAMAPTGNPVLTPANAPAFPPVATQISAPAPSLAPPVPASALHYASVCIGGTALKSAADSDLTKRMKDHLCLSLAASAADVAKRFADPKFSDAASINDQCKTITASIRADLSVADTPQATVDRLRDKLKILTSDQRDTAVDSYSFCAAFGLTSNTLDYVNTNAIALAALNEPQYLEFVATQAALGIEEAPNTAKAADWFEVAAKSPVSIVQLSAPDPVRRARMDYFKSVAAELRQPTTTSAQTVAALIPKLNFGPKPTVTDTPQFGTAPAGVQSDTTALKPMSRSDLADFIRPSVVLVYAPDAKGGASLGTGYFVTPDLIVTNTHVVEDTDRDVIIANKTLGARVAHIVAKGMTRDRKGIDAAILQMAGTPSPNFLKINRRIREGQAISIGGFPARAQEGHDKAFSDFLDLLRGQRIPTADAIPAPKFDFGYVQALVTNPSNNLHNLQIGLNTTHGNSGSPIVDSCGNAVGLDFQISIASLDVVKTSDGSGWEARGDSAHFSYALQMDEVVKFMDTLRVPYSETTAACSE